MYATTLWFLWQDLLAPFACAFTRPGFARFVEWLTGLLLNVEEHTITQSLVALDRTADWKALESFAEYGHWEQHWIDYHLAQLIDEAPGRLWHGYAVSAGDDTKVHRSSANVWGTCTFHEYTARCPNRASTVRAHNWVILGALLHHPGQPAWFLPQAGRLYFRKSQLPAPSPGDDEPIVFRTKNELLLELAQRQACISKEKQLVVFDGAFAVRNVVRPLVLPEDPAQPRVDFITRLRHDSRLYYLPGPRKPGQRGPTPRWGKKLSPPRQGGRWPGGWHRGRAFLYGRWRKVRYKEVICLWRVLGHEVPVKAVVAKVEGYGKRFTLVSSALDLSGLQIVELFAARFRQEDGFGDLKQRLGWEECRAWTKNPIVRTTGALLLLLSLMRLLEFRLAEAGKGDWWQRPPWNSGKQRPSIRDMERLWWQHRGEIQQHLAGWVEEQKKKGEPERKGSGM
jgi:hypothetical protein